MTDAFFAAGEQYLDRPGVSFCSRTTYDDNAITNAVEIYDCPRSLLVFLFPFKFFPSGDIIVSKS